jgi:CRISPR-associated endonuclease Csn1
MERVLGLDLGVASIGWGLVDINEDQEHLSKIVDGGSRIFQGNNKRAEAGSTTSANEERRNKRSARRNRERTKRRKRKLLHIMRRKGLAPAKSNFDQWVKINPYEVRAKGLEHKLSLEELGRAFYHINQRRGFESNRKTPLEEGESVVRADIAELDKEIKKSGSRTLGEYLFEQSKGNQSSDASNHTRLRGRYTSRSQYKEEFNMLWKVQKQFHPDVLTKKYKGKVYDAIFYQRPVSSQAQFIGNCELENDKKRIARGHRLYQEFRIWKNINNLIAWDETGEELPIPKEQREALYEELRKRTHLTFNQLKRKLGWNSNAEFNLESALDKMPGHRTNAKLADEKAIGDRWYDLDEEIQDHIIDVLLHVEKEDIITQLATQKWGCTDEQADYLKRLELEPGYGRFSHKAINKLLPHLRKGVSESEAIKKLYEGFFEQNHENLSELPLPDEIRNPVVYHAMVELRKVVNAIIRKYGMPDKIRVELARELKSGSRRREEIQKKQKRLKKLNDEANEALKKAPFNIQHPTYNDRLWYKLWLECEKTCPYSGESIPASRQAMSVYEIEHILPFSRSIDNSYMNKTLCKTELNNRKGNQTPKEAFGSDEEHWDAILQRIRVLPRPKSQRFLEEDIQLDTFVQRQLNDTQYISALTREFLEKLDTNVEVVKGVSTSIFRRSWGLNRILNEEGLNVKNRDDHRHHTIDAFVVANTTPRMMRRLANTHERDRRHNRFPVGQPWPTFYDQLEEHINEIIVSHRVHRAIRGALHEDSFYGPTNKKSSKKDHEWLVMRKDVHELTKKELGWKAKTQSFSDDEKVKIRDPRIREIVRNKVREKMDQGLSFDKSVEALSEDYPKIKSEKAHTPIKRVRLIHLKPLVNFQALQENQEEEHFYAKYGNNHHIAIYETKDGKQEYMVVPMYEAARRVRAGDDLVLRDHPEGHKFLFSLSQDEMIKYDEDGKYYRVQQLPTSGQVRLRRHDVADDRLSNKEGRILKQGSQLKAQKVVIDPIGQIREAND